MAGPAVIAAYIGYQKEIKYHHHCYGEYLPGSNNLKQHISQFFREHTLLSAVPGYL
jgi:hypothetical protein